MFHLKVSIQLSGVYIITQYLMALKQQWSIIFHNSVGSLGNPSTGLPHLHATFSWWGRGRWEGGISLGMNWAAKTVVSLFSWGLGNTQKADTVFLERVIIGLEAIGLQGHSVIELGTSFYLKLSSVTLTMWVMPSWLSLLLSGAASIWPRKRLGQVSLMWLSVVTTPLTHTQ